MTVGELIEQLKDHDLEDQVVFKDEINEQERPVYKVMTIHWKSKDQVVAIFA